VYLRVDADQDDTQHTYARLPSHRSLLQPDRCLRGLEQFVQAGMAPIYPDGLGALLAAANTLVSTRHARQGRWGVEADHVIWRSVSGCTQAGCGLGGGLKVEVVCQARSSRCCTRTRLLPV
jgi:hypothetical protein